MSVLNLNVADTLTTHIADLGQAIVNVVDGTDKGAGERLAQIRAAFLATAAGDVRPLVDLVDLSERLDDACVDLRELVPHATLEPRAPQPVASHYSYTCDGGHPRRGTGTGHSEAGHVRGSAQGSRRPERHRHFRALRHRRTGSEAARHGCDSARHRPPGVRKTRPRQSRYGVGAAGVRSAASGATRAGARRNRRQRRRQPGRPIGADANAGVPRQHARRARPAHRGHTVKGCREPACRDCGAGGSRAVRLQHAGHDATPAARRGRQDAGGQHDGCAADEGRRGRPPHRPRRSGQVRRLAPATRSTRRQTRSSVWKG